MESLCFLVICNTGFGKQVLSGVNNLLGLLETFCGEEEVEGQTVGVGEDMVFQKCNPELLLIKVIEVQVIKMKK